MKKINLLTLAFIAVLTVFTTTSCKKAKDTLEKIQDSIGASSFSCKIDGQDWFAFAPAARIEKDALIIATTNSADSPVKGEVAITIHGLVADEYNLSKSPLKAECAIVYRKTTNLTNDSDDYYAATSATVVITNFADEKYSGTYVATLENKSGATITITEGKFENVPLFQTYDK